MPAIDPPQGVKPPSLTDPWFEHAPSPMAIVGGATHEVRDINSAFCRLIGKPRQDVLGKAFCELLPEHHECLALLDGVYHTGEPAILQGQEHADPEPVFSSYAMWPMKTDDRTMGAVIQVTETASLHEKTLAMNEALLLGSLRQHELAAAAREANVRLEAEIVQRVQSERDALMLTHEISHRIKNNLQSILALISNEIKRTPAEFARGYVAMEARIAAIAKLYELISLSRKIDTISLDDYLHELAKTMTSCLLEPSSAISIQVKGTALEIAADRAVPFGLIVNELGTNAIKHAFPDGVGHIMLSIEQVDDQIELIVADDGVGITAKESTKAAGRHGSDYVAIFVRQLGGTMTVSRMGRGTTITIQFPMLVVS